MSYETERDWTTAAGFRAVVLMVSNGSHRCGYVAVPSGHPLHGISYSEPCAALEPISGDTPIGKRGLIPLLCAANGDEGRMRSPENVFDVHGSLTFSGDGKKGYPAAGEDEWWFGFDCAHCDDKTAYSDGVERTLEYVAAECESLAAQIKSKAQACVTGMP